MKSITRFAKRALSLVLCLTMVMTTMLFFDLGITKSEAAISGPETQTKGRVAFYVPEVIYLYPNVMSWKDNTSTPFQYYVQNDPLTTDDGFFYGGNVNSGLSTFGWVYFSSEGGYSNVTLSKRFVDANGNPFKDANGNDISNADSIKFEKAQGEDKGTFYQYKITEGQSPVMSASQTGCFIEWTLHFTDNLGEQKAAIAYTYVYKPNTRTYGGSNNAFTDIGDDSRSDTLTWVSGVHSVTATTDKMNDWGYPAFNYKRSFAGFLSADPYGYVNGTKNQGTKSQNIIKERLNYGTDHEGLWYNTDAGAKDMYTVFSASPSSGNNGYFKDLWCQNPSDNTGYTITGGDGNKDSWEWLENTNLAGQTYDGAYFNHYKTSGDTRDQNGVLNVTSKGDLFIDYSRYKNLNQIPNLGVCLMVTDCSGCAKGGAWYVADATGVDMTATPIAGQSSVNYAVTGAYNGEENGNILYDKKGTVMARAGGAAAYTMTQDSDIATYEGRKYCGTWYSPIAETEKNKEKTFIVKSYYCSANKTSDGTKEGRPGYASVHTFIRMYATITDKTALRNKIYEAISLFGKFGVTDGFNSKYYNSSSTEWQNLRTAYRQAYMVLTKLDGRSYYDVSKNSMLEEVEAATTALTNAINAVNAAGKIQGKAIQYNLGLMKNSDGKYRIFEMPERKYFEKTYSYGDKIEFTQEAYTGYTFKSMVKVTQDTSVPALISEAYSISGIPASTSASNINDYRFKQSGNTTTYTNEDSSTALSKAAFSGSTVTYKSATDAELKYIYFYELTQSEVLFGNEFDFDYTRWLTPTGGTQIVDRINNTVKLTATADNTFSETYHCDTQQGSHMDVIPGRTYRFSVKVRNDSSNTIRAQMFFFTFAKTTDHDTISSPDVSQDISPKQNDDDFAFIHKLVTIPADAPYATLRVGFRGAVGDSVTFKDICVRDVTTFLDSGETNTIYLDGDSTKNPALIPLNKTGAPGSTQEVNFENGTAPKLKRSGYQFAGWSEDRQANGNGGTLVTRTTIPANRNQKLYPVWRVNVTYNTNGGSYRKSDDPLMSGTNYVAEGRFSLDVGTSVAVSNRGRYLRDDNTVTDPNWNSTALSYSYVPFQIGKNFAGWEVKDSIDPTLKGQTFWPGETVPADANVEFAAKWVDATEIGTTVQLIESSDNGNSSNSNTQASLYPGQIRFFSFTPTQRNMYVSAFTFGTNIDTEINWFSTTTSETEENNNASEYETVYPDFGYYGLLTDSNIVFNKNTNSLLTKQLAKGEQAYFSVSLHDNTATTGNTINFRIREHQVRFKLNPNGGEVNNTTGRFDVLGYGGENTALNVDGYRYGYDFVGWKTETAEPIQKTYNVSNSSCTVPGADNTAWLDGYTVSFEREVYMEAMWSPAKFNVTYDGNKKANESTTPTGVPAADELTYDSTFRVTDVQPKRDGYTFKGWALTPDKQEGETLYPTNEKNLPVATVNTLYDAFMNKQDVKLYARWAPNVIIVRYKNSAVSSADEHTQKFFFDTPQDLDAVDFEAATYTVEFYNVHPTNGTETLATTDTADLDLEGWESNADVINPDTGKPFYYTNGQLGVINPNGVFGYSDVEAGAEETILNAKWKGGNSTVNAPVIVNDDVQYILAGWADPTDETADKVTVDYLPGQDFTPKGDSKLYAVWYSTQKAEEAEKNLENFTNEQPVITGIKITDGDLTSENSYQPISAGYSIVEYDTEDYQKLVNAYITAKNNFDAVKTSTNEAAKITANNNLLTAIKNLEAVKNPETAQKAVNTYIDKFKIEYADSVPESERLVDAGEYSVADMNLNHYTEGVLGAAKQAIADASTIVYATGQQTINKSVITLARAYASKEDVKTSTPVYKVYDTAESLKSSGIPYSDDIETMSYVYTGKGNYTYYCYTNSTNPTLYLTVDEDMAVDGRACFPTTAEAYGDRMGTAGANPIAPEITHLTDLRALNKYKNYLNEGIGTTPVLSVDENGNKVHGTSDDYYGNKALIKLTPDFTGVSESTVSATVEYTFKAYDDAYAGADNTDVNYADAATLVSGASKGKLNDIPQGEKATNQSDGKVVTPENTITIKIDYHVSAADGGKIDVNGKQVQDDEWLKQYHLIRTSGGASNWDLVKRDDAVYTIDDPTYGQNNFGSFTYTFRVGAANDFANCVLTSADVEDVKNIVKSNYDDIRSVAFTAAKATTRFAHEKDADGNDILDRHGNPKVYVETVPAGTGLGFKDWPQTTWSYNYYPASNVYTYVHVVDRWGNVVDKVINTPNVDANAAQFLSQSVGDVTVAELGGSGIDTMSFSAQSFDIITDENSTFDGETYTTTGNSIKVYTGEANKKYNLTANDVATNASTGTATTDAEGYLTITVDDLAFDTMSGEMYTFTLNGKTINLYAEVEDVILSAEDVTVTAGETATVSITTTDAPTMVQLVSASGATATATEYTEDEDGNRVWHIDIKKNPGSFEYEVKAKVDGKWITEGETVTVTVTEPTIFVGAVTAVEYTPSTSTRNEFMFTVTGRPDKIQVIEPDGGTRTYDRYHAKVIIVSYDEDGNMVGSMSRELCYEVWTIEMNVPADIELTAIARYGRKWSTDTPYKYTVVLATPEFDDEVYSMELASTEGRMGKVQATVITGLDVRGVRFVMDNDTTTTYYTATEADGKLTYVGNAWMNHYGENIIIVKIRVNNAWINAGELTYQAI